MDFKTIKCLSKFKEELPPINRPSRSASNQVIKVNVNKPYKRMRQAISSKHFTFCFVLSELQRVE